MGVLLKEALKRLCSANNWAYAVFWKIGCQNPNLIIWEESHYEPSLSSRHTNTARTESGESPFGEWEGCWASSNVCSSSHDNQPEEIVSALLNKMLLDKPFTIVGEGIVGRAAFTGNHQWILSRNYSIYAHPPEVLNEMHHQFSAGMQTVAVIPVLPHGVVQLGSSLAIMENIGFINDVRNLILQLGCVPGALLSEIYDAKSSVEKAGVQYNTGMLTTGHLGGHATSSSYMTSSYNHQNQSSSQAPRLVGQPSHSIFQEIQKISQAPISTCQTPNLTQTLSKIPDDLQQTLMKPKFSRGGELRNGVGVAEVINSNSEAWLNHLAPSNLRCGLKYPCGSVQSAASQGSLELILSGGSMFPNLNSKIGASNSFISITNGTLNLDQRKSLITTPLLEGSQAHGELYTHLRPTLVTRSHSEPHGAANMNLSGTYLPGVKFQKTDSFQTDGVSLSSLADQSASQDIISKGSHFSREVKFTQSDMPPVEKRIENKLFQALDIPSTHPHEHVSLSDHIPRSSHDGLVNISCTARSLNTKNDDVSAQISSGDDLFDVLGVDFKNKLLNGNWTSLLADEPGSNKRDLAENAVMFAHVKDLVSDCCAASEGISNGSIFSGAGADHLLDAVVSKGHSTIKQSSDDNLSCKTTLTKISTSSIPSGSPTYGQLSVSTHVPGETLDLPKDLGKAGLVEINSFLSGICRDDAGNCSQTTSIYGSQVSSWVESGNKSKHESSVSTAYSKKPDLLGKSNRKRLKPGENPRPRPKDRQMIQDRVKELREIVPNAAKCSIDALLERTIKHMLFLQSVTKHADKLKQTGKAKIIGKETGLHLKDNFDGRATWAFDVGSQSMVCPIIVEDLDSPRQMLVEMLCEEHGFFLEIADLIRGLGLTILKGMMENRNDKIWARFAVEANRDVTRMEIFMSLVHLLEQTVKGTVPSVTAIKRMVQHSFAQTTPIPATGLESLR
ncbi:transcription factor LHW isoform X2 [Argentina anserina]|uniref:transcription factor LHW isoform X2 n=1 Tax=Argentina anserina TaxID=57926 RepID=UPI0021768C23|nr:transcription factor LHW isoform X2 [Potentilla anserina]XP_050368672.1 transcription factor LHW isoform X2 [Potentilla anserina]